MKYWLAILLGGGFLLFASEAAQPEADRVYSVEVLTRIARPVLTALAQGRLKQDLPAHVWERDRTDYAGLEALGRTLAGIAPWLELGPDETSEGKLRGEFIKLSVQAIANGTDRSRRTF